MPKDNKRPLEPTELSYVIEAKVRGEIKGVPSGTQIHAINCFCHELIKRKSSPKMNLNPSELSELIKTRIA